MNIKYYIFAILLLIIFLGYISLRKENVKETYEILKIEKNKWESLNLDTYEYTIKTDSNGLTVRYNSTISVKDSHFFSELQNDGYGNHSTEQFEDTQYQTIDNIYDYLEEILIYHNKEKIDLFYTYCKSISIKYDLNYHIPIEIEFKNYKFPFIMDIPTWELITIENFKINNSETNDFDNITVNSQNIKGIENIEDIENTFVYFDANIVFNEVISFLGNQPPSNFKLGEYDKFLNDTFYYNRDKYGHLIKLSKKQPNSRNISEVIQQGSVITNFNTMDEANKWLSMFRDIVINDTNWKNDNPSDFGDFYDIYVNNNIYITFQKPIHTKKEFSDPGRYHSLFYFSIGPKILFL